MVSDVVDTGDVSTIQRGQNHSSAIPEHSYTTSGHETNALTIQAVTVQIITMVMMEYL